MFHAVFSRVPPKQQPSRPRRKRLEVECLEDRTLLSTAALVKDINVTGTFGSSPSKLTEVNGTLYYLADDGIHGREHWQTDGTPDGILLVKDINPGAGSSSPTSLTNVNGTLFFAAFAPTYGTTLWKSDGTADGTRPVVEVIPPSSFRPGSPQFLTSFGGKVFFTATTAVHGRELWQSDGTAEGTVLVQDIKPGFADAFGGPFQSPNLRVANGKLFFSATDGRRQGDPRYLGYMDFNRDDGVGLIDLLAFVDRLGRRLQP